MNNQNKHIIDMMKQKNIKYIMIKQFIFFLDQNQYRIE